MNYEVLSSIEVPNFAACSCINFENYNFRNTVVTKSYDGNTVDTHGVLSSLSISGIAEAVAAVSSSMGSSLPRFGML